MKRRAFLKTIGSTGLLMVVTPNGIINVFGNDSKNNLLSGFLEPPAAARPHTFWYWMNGHISREGITRDLESMKNIGLGGFLKLNCGVGIPKGPVVYLSPEWISLVEHTAKEAERLGLDFAMHNSPGWSSSGGPWITPEMSMQNVVWTETVVKGGKQKKITLPQPVTKLNYYKDTYVIAFPSSPAEIKSLNNPLERLSTNSGSEKVNHLTEGQGIEVHPKDQKTSGYLLMEFKNPFEAKNIQIEAANLAANNADSFNSMKPVLLQSSDDGVNFKTIYKIGNLSSETSAGGNFRSVTAKYYRLMAPEPVLLKRVRLSPAVDTLPNWEIKAGFARPKDTRMTEPAPFAGSRPPKSHSPVSAGGNGVSPDAIIDSRKIIDITKYMDVNGAIEWDAPEGYWTILRFGHTPTGAGNRAAPDTGQGLECDKLRRDAFDLHFNSMFQQLLPFMKPLADKGKVAIEIDSYEAGMQNWTGKFPEAFKASRGYDIQKYLPAMTGRVIDSTTVTEGFLSDVRRVIADMMADNYYGRCAELCRQHNLTFFGEPYKLGPFENMQAASRMQIVMGEFWSRGQRNKHTLKLASSVQHINGRKIVGAEAFTGMPIYSKWQQFPFSLKAQGDFMFSKGLNRMIFHVFAHQSHPTVQPGMTMGQFGTHFDRNNTWFNHGAAWMEYLSRCQFMLQQGLFVADLLYYTGGNAPGEELGLRETPLPVPPLGYDYDNINTEVLMNRARVENGRIVLPDNMSYKLMILPLQPTMTVPVLMKIRELVKNGMCLMGAKPKKISGLSGVENNAQFDVTVSEIWGNLDGKKKTSRTFGAGKIFWEESVENVLKKLNISPDFDFTSESSDPGINFIHRRDNETEIYFISNRRRRPENLIGLFRVIGKKPEFWDAVTGTTRPAPLYDIINGQTRIPLQLDEAGSVFVIFRGKAAEHRLISIKRNNKELLGLSPFMPKAAKRYRDVVNSFTISTWIKPETDIAISGMNFLLRHDVASFVCYPSSGEKLYGKGHSICGLTAGRNGVVVYERKNEDIDPVLEVKAALSGWTHLAMVYNNGEHRIYINGKLSGKGQPTGSLVHPSAREEYQDIYTLYFEGDMTPAEVVPAALSEEQVRGLMEKKVSRIKKYTPIEVKAAGNQLLIWENGTYSMLQKNNKNLSYEVSSLQQPTELDGTWEVMFPPELGAPTSITLPALISLHKHADAGVKYFSGTASYRKNFIVSESEITNNNRLFLDLGQVEVLAEVVINGKALGTLWTRPYRIDITDSVKKGQNSLEIKVTNCWPNRLIGDEQFDDEYIYTNKNSGPIKRMPEWFVEGKPKPESNRITFSTYKHYSKDSPLLESGLIGPVTLRRAISYSIA